MPVYKIGLTGGMGSGKSTAAKVFSELGISVIDADIIARELVKLGQPALAEIAAFFGKEILTSKGELNRTRLRNLIFENEKLRSKLESILHPRILQEMHSQAGKLTASNPYCILVIPLLLETAQECYVNRILVIDTLNDTQRHRIKIRDGLSDKKINAILRTQCPPALRLAAADDSISNNTDLAALYHQIKCYHQQYLILAQQHAIACPIMNEHTKRPIYCPTCKAEITWSEENPWRPFCSQRCRLIDLGAWATESHRIPGEDTVKLDSDTEE